MHVYCVSFSLKVDLNVPEELCYKAPHTGVGWPIPFSPPGSFAMSKQTHLQLPEGTGSAPAEVRTYSRVTLSVATDDIFMHKTLQFQGAMAS